MEDGNGNPVRRRSSGDTSPSSGGAIAVLPVVEHSVLRTALRALLSIEPDIRVPGDAANEEEGVDLARLLRPDVVLLDGAIATSGDYARFFDHGRRRYHHILDPGTGEPRLATTCSV